MQITDRIFHQESINDYDAIGETNSLEKTSYSPMKNPLTFPSDFWDPKMAPESTSFPGQVPGDLRNWLRLGRDSAFPATADALGLLFSGRKMGEMEKAVGK